MKYDIDEQAKAVAEQARGHSPGLSEADDCIVATGIVREALIAAYAAGCLACAGGIRVGIQEAARTNASLAPETCVNVCEALAKAT